MSLLDLLRTTAPSLALEALSGQLVSVCLCVWLFQVFSDIGGAL